MMRVIRFPACELTDTVDHGFTLRVPGLNVQTDRTSALERLRNSHDGVLRQTGGLAAARFAEQIHGGAVAGVTFDSSSRLLGVDGLATSDRRVTLAIHVADCCAIYLIDPVQKAIALIHSGRKGTQANIAAEGVRQLSVLQGSRPEDLVAQLSPCIRPPYYEVDIAATIIEQLRLAGVKQIHDCAENTGRNLERYYSYRMEKGSTGRMLAFMRLRS